MDYKAFMWDVYLWIEQANQMAMKHGIDSEMFWNWVSESIAVMCDRYENNRLVIKQMTMLAEWLEEAYTKKVGGNSNG